MNIPMERVVVSFEPGTTEAHKINRLRELLFRQDLNQSPNNPNVFIRETDDPEYLLERVSEVFKEYPYVAHQIQRYVS